MKGIIKTACIALLIFVLTAGNAVSRPATSFGKGAGEYTRLFDSLKKMLLKRHRTVEVLGKKRNIYVFWIRDQIHAVKSGEVPSVPDISSLTEMYLENQTPEGMYYDYFYPLKRDLNHRMNVFDHRYWKIFSDENLQMHRLPVEADLEYLLVEGVHYVWQATGDTEFVKKWLPALERGLTYSMTDPLRWSKKYHLVKRGYTIDTWDFMQLPATRDEFISQGGDLQKGIFNIDSETPMGIMHGDNSGMYAACRQLAQMHAALGNEGEAENWNAEAEVFRTRTNNTCWNGKYYAHFVEDDPMPPYLHIDQENTLSLSNTYDINRGLPNEDMAQSIIQTYLDLKEETKDESIAEWYGIYPPVQPHYADHEPGSYVNGGVLSIVAGELAKAAFQHGYESYGVDILDRVLKLVDKHDGWLDCAFRPDGTVDRGIPDNWGQAAVFSAMVEGLAGVVDRGCLYEKVGTFTPVDGRGRR